MSTFFEDDRKAKQSQKQYQTQGQDQDQKPVEFTDVIKPEDVSTMAIAGSTTTTDVALPAESQVAMVAASISESKEWKPFLSQLNDAQIQDVKLYAPREQFQIEVDGKLKSYTRKKIKTRDYAHLEELRANFAKASGLDRTKLQIEIFQKAALYYLGMSEQDFDNCDFETIKKIIDANNIRTLYGVPNSR